MLKDVISLNNVEFKVCLRKVDVEMEKEVIRGQVIRKFIEQNIEVLSVLKLES